MRVTACTTSEEKEIQKRALAMLRAPTYVEASLPAGDRQGEPEVATESQAETAESLTAKVLVEFQPDEGRWIVAAWRELFGMNLDVNRVQEHLAALRSWQARWQRRS